VNFLIIPGNRPSGGGFGNQPAEIISSLQYGANSIAGSGFVVSTVQSLNNDVTITIEGDGVVSTTITQFQNIVPDTLDSSLWELEYVVDVADSQTGISRTGQPLGQAEGGSLLWDAISLSGIEVPETNLIKLDALIRNGQIYITVRNGDDLSGHIKNLEMTQKSGAALPNWFSKISDNLYIVKAPVDQEEIALTIKAAGSKNELVVQNLTLNLRNGQVENNNSLTPNQVASTFSERTQGLRPDNKLNLNDALGRN